MKKESTPESGKVKNQLQQNSVNEVWSGKWMLTGLEAAGGPGSGDNREKEATSCGFAHVF